MEKCARRKNREDGQMEKMTLKQKVGQLFTYTLHPVTNQYSKYVLRKMVDDYGVGEWTKQYGETIYGTRGGDISPRDWGVTTRKGDKLYVHILNLPDKGLFLPLTTGKVKSAVVFKDRKPVKFSQDKNGVVLELAEEPAELDYVIELTIK